MYSVRRAVELVVLGVVFIPFATVGQTAHPAQNETSPKADTSSFSQEAAVIENLEMKVRFENDGRATYDTAMRARIQSEAAVHDDGLLVFPYLAGIESFDIKYVRVRKPNATVIETPLDTIQDLTSEVARSAPMYTDQREKHVAVKALSVGDVLEYQTVSTVRQPLAPGQFWFSYDFSKQTITLREHLEINVPKDRGVKVLSPDVTPVISEDGNRRVYIFQTSHLKKDPEPDKWEAALNGPPPPAVQVSSFASWDEVASWYGSLQKPRVQITPEVRAKAEELTRDQKTDSDKLLAIYDYVSTQFRYISISLGQGRYAPHTAAEVLANQFGDCKDKHTLLASLLQAVGIDAYPVLTASTMRINSEMPTPALFDHLITAVPKGSAFLFLDSTPGVAPPGFLTRPLRDKLVLVVLADGKALLAKTPVNPPFPMFQHFTMSATLDAHGTLEGQARLEARGDGELALRQAFRNTPQSNWKDLAQAFSASSGFGGTVDDVAAASPDDTSAPFWFTYSYHRPEYGDWPNHRIVLPFPMIGLPELSKEDAESAAVLPLGPRQEITYEARLALPKGFWSPTPTSIQEKREFAEYDSSYALEGGVLRGTRHLLLLQPEVPATKRSTYVSLRRAIDEDERRWIDLVGGGITAASAHSSNPEAQRLFDEASQSIQLGAPWGASKSIEQALKLDPTWVDAWLLLGRARMMNSQLDPAVAAFRKAISLDPSNVEPYKVLAESLASHYRVPEAAQVWRDRLKVAPDDRDASTKLAALLVDSAKYTEARPLLEKLVGTEDAGARLHFQLGRTYIALGEEEKATAQFQKAMDLQPGPGMLNSVAYALAESNRRLADALRYAEQCVQQAEGETSVFQLASANRDDYALMSGLAAEWDTLGWVHFRLGNLDAAERYIAAAWRLTPNPVIGDHLAQTYEKQGKKMLATHTYILALNSLSVNGDPELRDKLFSRAQAGNPPDSLWSNARKELQQMYTFSLNGFSVRAHSKGSAQFAIAFSKGPRVEEIRFVQGPDDLRPAESAIAALNYNVPFPDDAPTRIIRLGAVNCFPDQKDCTFVLLPPPPPPQQKLP